MADEDVAMPVVEALRHLEYDVVTMLDLGQANLSVDDDEVLDLARNNRRALVTRNRRHFRRLHEVDPNHAGIIACTVDLDFAVLTTRINEAIRSTPSLDGQFVRVYRPSSPSGPLPAVSSNADLRRHLPGVAPLVSLVLCLGFS